MVLRPFAPAALPAFFATTASADFSSALTEEISPGKVQNLSPRAAWLYLMRLDDFWASLFRASLPPAPGLTASSCSCGREFACRFFRLHLAATPCGSATVAVIGSDWLLSSNKILPMLGTPCGGLVTRPRGRRLPTGAQDTILPHDSCRCPAMGKLSGIGLQPAAAFSPPATGSKPEPVRRQSRWCCVRRPRGDGPGPSPR